jgi:hypothetical protein
MSESFQKWGKLKENMTMMLRDNASNVIKVCQDWEIPHFGCIGHTLHLIVSPLFVQKRGTGTSINDDNNNCNEQLDDIVDYDEEDLIEAINKLNNENYKSSIKSVSQVIACFQTVTKSIRQSTIAKEKLETIQRTNSTNVINVELDVQICWNSTLSMLLKLVRLKT